MDVIYYIQTMEKRRKRDSRPLENLQHIITVDNFVINTFWDENGDPILISPDDFKIGFTRKDKDTIDVILPPILSLYQLNDVVGKIVIEPLINDIPITVTYSYKSSNDIKLCCDPKYIVLIGDPFLLSLTAPPTISGKQIKAIISFTRNNNPLLIDGKDIIRTIGYCHEQTGKLKEKDELKERNVKQKIEKSILPSVDCGNSVPLPILPAELWRHILIVSDGSIYKNMSIVCKTMRTLVYTLPYRRLRWWIHFVATKRIENYVYIEQEYNSFLRTTINLGNRVVIRNAKQLKRRLGCNKIEKDDINTIFGKCKNDRYKYYILAVYDITTQIIPEEYEPRNIYETLFHPLIGVILSICPYILRWIRMKNLILRLFDKQEKISIEHAYGFLMYLFIGVYIPLTIDRTADVMHHWIPSHALISFIVWEQTKEPILTLMNRFNFKFVVEDIRMMYIRVGEKIYYTDGYMPWLEAPFSFEKLQEVRIAMIRNLPINGARISEDIHKYVRIRNMVDITDMKHDATFDMIAWAYIKDIEMEQKEIPNERFKSKINVS